MNPHSHDYIKAKESKAFSLGFKAGMGTMLFMGLMATMAMVAFGIVVLR